ncbi:hypothetical protein D0962_00225 [Leptolyngbyaceae cyanobacterium CCMR0082]|uniref:Uncharacterized protein n=2 Tax=Adonisia turfae TaxID=2950184 RepID=A0A6M0RYC3_9CYAN|nr:hypothetical protein [Adonisia turfae]MDV3351917.1 hypothetical protein [Leptothoe sp. LEGE 181152]NEZ57767.1 hypothetical protein [Adonisia turfae CCMR0081]NEZ61215.1 hypothetical protein [Adonisia turfae CCMR0082]
MYVIDRDRYPHLDLRVDHDEQPLVTLRTAFEESCKDYYQSFRQAMPSEQAQVLPLETPWLDEAV